VAPERSDPIQLDPRARYALDKVLRSGQGNWDHIEALLREIVTAHNNTVTFINQQLAVISDIINSGGQTSASDTDVDTTDFDTIPPTADDTQTVIEYIDQTLTQLIELRGASTAPLALDGEDAYQWPQGGGGSGAAGATGATGPAGPATPGFPGLDGEDSYSWAIPGTKGDPGTAGSTGSTGPTGVGVPGDAGEDAYDWAMPGTKGDPGRDGGPGVGVPGEPGEDGYDWAIPGPASVIPGPPGPATPGPPGDEGEAAYDWAMPGTKGDPGRDGAAAAPIPGSDGDDGYDWQIPGAAGAGGAAGATGAPGPATPGPPGDEGEAAYDWAMPGTKGDPGKDGVEAVPIPGVDGEDGYDWQIPGNPGAAGAASTVPGPAGPATPGIPGDPGEDAYDWAIPGSAGAAGTAGAAGVAGPATPGIPGDPGEDAYDWAMPGTKGDPGRDGAPATSAPGVDGEDAYDFPNPGRDGAAGAAGAPGSSAAGGATTVIITESDDAVEWPQTAQHRHEPAPDIGFFDVGQTGVSLIPATEQFLDQFSVLKIPGTEVVTIPGTSVLILNDYGSRGGADDVTKRFLGVKVKDTTQSVSTGAGTWTAYNWGAFFLPSYFFDPVSMFSGSTVGFTIRKAGWYRITGQMTFSGDATASRRGCAIGINGTPAPPGGDPQSLHHNGTSVTQQAGNVSGLWQLKVGDTFNLSGFSDTAVNMSSAQISAEFVGV
jgi:hypothetical protein